MELWNDFVNLVDGWKLILMVALILANVASGICVALKNKEFTFAGAAGWLRDRFLGLVVPYFCIGVAGVADPSVAFLVPTAYGFITAFLIAKILANAQEFGIPLPLPEIITKRLV